MRVISLKRIFSMVWERKGIFTLIIILCAILGILNSVRTYKGKITEAESAVAEYEKELNEYSSNLAQQDETIAALKENLISIKEQYEDQKTYCDNSIFMQLNANEIWCGEAQYTYLSDVDDYNTMTALVAYCESVEMRGNLEERTGFSEKQLKDLLFANIESKQGRIVKYYVYALDEETARLLIEGVVKELEAVKPQIEKAQGNYSDTLESIDVGVCVDTNVQTSQNSAMKLLRDSLTSVTDTKNTIESKQITRDKYASENIPEAVYPMGRVKKVLHFAKGVILGLVIGIVIVVFLCAFRILFGKKILDEECLKGREIHVLNLNGDDESHIDAAGEDIYLCARKESFIKLIVLMISVNDAMCKERLRVILSDKSIEVEFIGYRQEDAKTLAKIGEYDGALLYVQKGSSLHKDFEDAYNRLDRYGIKLLGGLFDNMIVNKKMGR